MVIAEAGEPVTNRGWTTEVAREGAAMVGFCVKGFRAARALLHDKEMNGEDRLRLVRAMTTLV